MEEIVIVGASLAGVRAAEAFRREGYRGSLTLIGAELHFPPYDRPPLSKEILAGEWGAERGRLRIQPELDATLVLGRRAVGLDLDRSLVALNDGSNVAFDGLVVATGATPRMLAGVSPELAGVFVLRSFDDSMALRGALERARHVVVVGAGFIGAEVAAVCRGRGLQVTVVEPLAVPMERALGPELGAWAADLHRSNGVDLRLGVGVREITGSAHVEAVTLADGTECPADVVVVAVGVVPETAWLEGSGLEVDNGIVLDETCRALGVENVVAAGDVARWRNPMFGRTMRVEHWANAVEQADAAARTLLSPVGEAEPFSSVPYFWSDQYDKKLQYVGIGGSYAAILDGSLDEGRFVAGFELDGRFVGALCVNSPRRMIRCRRLIAEDVDIAAAIGALSTA